MIVKVTSNSIIKCDNEYIKQKLIYILNNFISFYIFKINIEISIDNKNFYIKNEDIIQFHYLDLPNNIITSNNINSFLIKFKDYKNSFVFGKGPTFINRGKENNELYFGVNQTINILNNCDFFCANDLHNIYKIDDFSKIKYILIPEYLHINGAFNKKGHWFQVYEYLKDKFNGDIIIFNLRTCKYKNNQFINIPKCKTTSNVAVNFICIFLNLYIKKVTTYGVGIICNTNYNKKFIGNGEYKKDRINIIKNEIIDICNQYNITLIMK